MDNIVVPCFFWLSVFACSFSVDIWKWHQQICKITTQGIRGIPWENVQLTAQKDVIVNSFDLKFVNKVRVFSLLSFAWLWSPYEIGQTITFLLCGFFYLSLWSPYVIEQTIIFLSCFFLSSFFLLFFPRLNLSGRRLDVYHTSVHGVALVQI